jgi:hypothetical protein
MVKAYQDDKAPPREQVFMLRELLGRGSERYRKEIVPKRKQVSDAIQNADVWPSQSRSIALCAIDSRRSSVPIRIVMSVEWT